MFRGDHHVGRSIEGVGTGGEDAKDILFRLARIAPLGSGCFPAVVRIGIADVEIDLGPDAAADPVALKRLDTLGPIERLEVLFQTVGVVGDAEHPLPQRHPLNGVPSPFADTVDDFFVGQYRSQFGTPVHRCLDLVGQTVVVDVAANRVGAFGADIIGDRQFGNGTSLLLLRVVPGVVDDEEYPLGPAEIVDIGCRDLAVPVETQTEHLQLTAEVRDVLLGRLPRVDTGLFSVLLGGEAESVPPHRVEDRETVHPLIARDDIRGGVSFRVTDMKAVSARVREHIQNICLLSIDHTLPLLGETGRGEGLMFFPVFLPERFNLRRIIAGHRRCFPKTAFLKILLGVKISPRVYHEPGGGTRSFHKKTPARADFSPAGGNQHGRGR